MWSRRGASEGEHQFESDHHDEEADVDGNEPTEELRKDLSAHVATDIGKFARPGLLLFAPDLPKTRSGKIMRRLLKNIAEGKELGDATTLRDPSILLAIKEDADRQLGR